MRPSHIGLLGKPLAGFHACSTLRESSMGRVLLIAFMVFVSLQAGAAVMRSLRTQSADRAPPSDRPLN